MISYECSICGNTQDSDSVPEICYDCGSKDVEWLNLITNKTEKYSKSKTKIKPLPIVIEIVTSPTPTITKPSTTTLKPIPPTPPRGPIMGSGPGLYIYRNNFDLNVPLGRICKETIFIRYSGTGNVTGKATSDFHLVDVKPQIINFRNYLFLKIIYNGKSMSYPRSKRVTIRLETTAGDYDIKFNLKVIETRLFEGLKYFFKPWK